MELHEALELRKAKYIKHWKGKDGKWHYRYPSYYQKKGRSSAAPKPERPVPKPPKPRADMVTEGTAFYHGTTASFDKFRPGLTYLTGDPAEAGAFAANPILAGHGEIGGKAKVVKITAKAGKKKNIDEEVMEGIMENTDPDEVIAELFPELEIEGVRYVNFMHPSAAGGEEFEVTVSLYPDKDLSIERRG